MSLSDEDVARIVDGVSRRILDALDGQLPAKSLPRPAAPVLISDFIREAAKKEIKRRGLADTSKARRGGSKR